MLTLLLVDRVLFYSSLSRARTRNYIHFRMVVDSHMKLGDGNVIVEVRIALTALLS